MEEQKPEIICKSDGTPFSDAKVAGAQKTIHERNGVMTKVVELEEGGFVLEVIQNRKPRRLPLQNRSVLGHMDKDPNFVYRFPTDKEGRLEAMQDAGWEFVRGAEKPSDEYVGATRTPGSIIAKPGGGGRTHYLMRKRREYFDEDEAAKQAEIRADEENLVRKAALDNLHTLDPGGRPGIRIARTGKR